MILYSNFKGGLTTDAPLLVGALTINSPGFANLPVVAGGDLMWLVLDPQSVNGTPEIVLVTAHTASATVVTVARGQQTGFGSFAAREHPVSTVWAAAATAQDFATHLTTILTTKGDLAVATGPNAVTRLPVGANGLPLVADSVEAAGVKYGQVVTAGVADNAVTNAKMADLAVGTAELIDDAVTFAKLHPVVELPFLAWQTYTPVLGVWTLGNGSSLGKYVQFGKTVHFKAGFTFGTTSAFTAGQPTISLPVANHADWTGDRMSVRVTAADATGGTFDGRAALNVTTAVPLVLQVSGINIIDINISSTVPFTWANLDTLEFAGTYESV